jgi:hypothetical protein
MIAIVLALVWGWLVAMAALAAVRSFRSGGRCKGCGTILIEGVEADGRCAFCRLPKGEKG